MWTYNRSGELYHFGIRGMRWGVRRFQKDDGRLTSSGKKRYDDNPSNGKPIQKSGKSRHRQTLEQKYLDSGLSRKQAEEAAAKRIKTEKIIAIAGAMTLAAATAYVVNKHIQEKSDHIIKSGKILQRIAKEDTVNTDHALYTSYKKMDNMKYRGMYGAQLKGFNLNSDNPVRKVSLSAKSDIKVASRDRAAGAFAKLYKTDPEFKTLFDRHIDAAKQAGAENDNRYRKVYRNIQKDLPEDKLKKYAYDAFNRQLAGHDSDSNTMAKKFYDTLRSQGYDAITDMNDRKYSGYGAKAPTIVFNAKNKLAVDKIEELGKQQVKKDFAKAAAVITAPKLVKAGAVFVGVPVLSNMAVDALNSKSNYPAKTPNKTTHK